MDYEASRMLPYLATAFCVKLLRGGIYRYLAKYKYIPTSHFQSAPVVLISQYQWIDLPILVFPRGAASDRIPGTSSSSSLPRPTLLIYVKRNQKYFATSSRSLPLNKKTQNIRPRCIQDGFGTVEASPNSEEGSSRRNQHQSCQLQCTRRKGKEGLY